LFSEVLVTFPVSQVEAAIWVPPLVGLVISFFTSMGGLSGAFLILPFQVSVLGFTSPAVSPTNLVFNVVAIPSGVYRYFREGRMNWPLAWNIIVGTLPGLVLGGIIRIVYLPDVRSFKLFVGIVLLYIGGRMIYQSILKRSPAESAARTAEARLKKDISRARETTSAHTYGQPAIRTVSWSLLRTEYEFYGERFSFHTTGLFLLSLLVGLVGGVYGVGGGAIIAPFIVSFFGLPVHTIAGATLMGTCVTSVGGVIFYSLAAMYHLRPELTVAPDWLLGCLFGIGGLVGMYLGAAAQKYVSAAIITPVLALLVAGLGLSYVVGYFL
jgi:uncharacterized membrane protein YfcA